MGCKNTSQNDQKTRIFEYKVLEKPVNLNIRRRSVRNFEYTELQYQLLQIKVMSEKCICKGILQSTTSKDTHSRALHPLGIRNRLHYYQGRAHQHSTFNRRYRHKWQQSTLAVINFVDYIKAAHKDSTQNTTKLHGGRSRQTNHTLHHQELKW